ncbi:MAG: lactate racemase domain-containing protein, partial [Chloroflexi bacterium]|nr:lactate racemase domain-containing protein [Chloroflexota bacterium]
MELPLGLNMQPLPLLVRVRQHLPMPAVSDIESTVRDELTRVIGGSIREGQRIALTAGSRGIAHIDRVLKVVSSWVRAEGGEPFIVAAMGSHGGASREGQLAVLTGYGVTEDAIGCPIVMETETVEAGRTTVGCPVTMARAAWDADGIIVVNRVKPHTILRPPLGSGLMKMTALGLSGPRGADAIHSYGLSENLIPAARILLGSGKITCGLAILENAKGQLARVEAVPVGDFE